jgi:4-amino-4-deoxy-L-arabinose transferase-like glycosyltransferase
MRPLAALVLAGSAVRLGLAAAIGLGVDESYMVASGRHFAWGYFDHPPLSWWLASGVAHLAGSEADMVVRLPFILLFALSTLLMARLGTELAGERAGVLAALAFNLAPVFGVTTGGWVLPDGPLTAALLAAALCLIPALEGRGTRWWLATGLMAGLALLSKYSAILVMAGAVAAMAATPRWRHWFARPQPWLAGLLALATFSPVLAWNAGHGWASFAFQGGRAAAARLHPFGPLAVLAGAAAFLLPWIWFGLLAGWWQSFRDGPDRPVAWLLAWLASGPILLFAIVALWSRQVLFHWAMPGYLFLFPALGARLATWPPVRARRWAAATTLLLATVIAIAVSEVRLNWLAAFRPGLDPGFQALDLTPLRGALAARGLLGQPVAALSWADAGKIDYALGGAPQVLCLNRDAREYGVLPGPERLLGRDILIVAPHRDPARVRAEYAPLFASLEALDPAQVPLPGRGSVSIPLFLGHTLQHWP